MPDSEEATGEFWFTHVGIVTTEEDVIGGLVVGGDVAAELDLRLQEGAGHVLLFNCGGFKVKAEDSGRVRDQVVNHIIVLKRREARKSVRYP